MLSSGARDPTNDWFIALNALTTLDEIIAVIQGADYYSASQRSVTSYTFPDTDVVLAGDGGSLVDASLLGGQATENETLTLSGAVNAIPAEYTVDKANKTVTISYDRTDTALTVMELFGKPTKAVLINGTLDDAILESPPWVRAFRGIRGSAGDGEVTPITVLFEGTMTLGAASAKITGDIVCPQTGHLNIYLEAMGGNRSNSSGYLSVPAARVYAADAAVGSTYASNGTTNNILAIALGANRAAHISANDTDHHLALGSPDGGSGAIYYIRITYVQVEGTSSGGTGTTLIPETDELIAYVEADEHNIINVNGKLYEVIRDQHAGHGKTVSLEELTHVNFRGFVDSVNDVLTPADGQFVYIYAESTGHTGGFQRYTTTGVTGFYPYRPFDSGNEWENAPTGFTYTGVLIYRGYRQDEVALLRVASSAGQVFVLLDERQVVFVDTYTAALANYDYFRTQNVVPEKVGPVAMVAFWGDTHTSANDRQKQSGITSFQYSGNLGDEYAFRVGFNGPEPDEIIYGEDFGVRTVVAADAPNADLMVGTPSGGVETTETLDDYRVFNFPAGKYLVSLYKEIGADNQDDVGLKAYDIQDGRDDLLIINRSVPTFEADDTPGFPIQNRAGAPASLDIVIIAATAQQITFIITGAGAAFSLNNLATVIYITKLEG